MKRLHFLFFVLCVLFAACVQKENYPSPLEGISIDNQSFTSESSKLTIEVNSSLANVQAEVLDMETMDFADWLKVDVSRQKLTLTITENISVNERTARVTLYTIDRNDVDNNSLTVVFYVTQTKNTQFDGLKIEEVVVDHHRCDTVVVFDHVVANVKATVVDLDGNKADWVKTTVGTNYLALAISEHVSKGERQALIRLLPNSKTQLPDSLLPSTNFLITQSHNPVLDSLTIEPQKLSSESGSHVIHTDRLLTNIRALAIDDATTQKASWLTVLVAGDSITLNTTAHSQQADRTATVTLYLPNHGDAIDSTTISLPFTVSQSHNNIFDGASYHHRYVEWNQTGDTLKLTRELKDIKCQLTDTLTHKNPSWLSASVEGKNVVFKPSKLTAKTDRTVLVTLYMGTLNEEAVQTSFYLTQRHNNIFDGDPFHDRTVEWNQLKDTLKLTRELTDIKCDLIDNTTKQKPTWLSATVSGKEVIFTTQNNSSKQERTATATLYLPNGSTIDANTIQSSFQFKQTGNTFFNGIKFEDQVVQWNQSLTELNATFDLRQVKSKLVDIATNKAPTWLSTSFDLDNSIIELKTSQLTTTDDRTATVTLYIPNGNDINENTEQISFKLTQHHNNIFDGEAFHDRTVQWDQKYDTLKLTRELTSIKCQLIDNETQKSPTWLTANIKGKNVEFTAQNNVGKQMRTATVTLYLPNGTTIDNKTVQTSFLFHQSGNNIFNGLQINECNFQWNENKKEIATAINLSSVRTQLVDESTQRSPDWLQVSLDNQTIIIKPSTLTSRNDRSALVTLYVPNNGTVIDGNTEQYNFRVTQHHNNIFDGAEFSNRTVEWNEKYDTLKLTRELTSIKCQLIDKETQKSPNWLTATIVDKRVEFVAQNNNSKFGRSATVTLYLPNGTTIDANTVQTSFDFYQKGNNMFENLNLEDKTMAWDQTYGEIQTGINMTNVRTKLIDNATQQEPTWLKVVLEDGYIKLKPSTLNDKNDRSATITLYVPNNGTTIDQTTLQTSFKLTQTHNNIFDENPFSNVTLKWNQTNDTIRTTGRELTNIACKTIDPATGNKPTWLSVTVSGREIILKADPLKTKVDRKATVTLYLPNNGTTINDNTVKTTFEVAQNHNNIFDGTAINKREVRFDQTQDTLKLTRDLTDMNIILVDNETKKAPRWLTAAIEEKTVVFTMQTNTSINTRSATVTLYLPNGYGYDENDGTTIKTTFQLEQGYEVKIIPDQKRIEVNYEKQDTVIHVTSNTKYQIQTPGNWVECILVSQTETTEDLHISFKENNYNRPNEGDIIITNAGVEVTRIALKQRTNPKIQVNFSDNRKEISVTRGAAEIELPVKTLTPVYTIRKKETWLSVGEQKTESYHNYDTYDQYYHKVKISQFTGNAFVRRDTLKLYNDEYVTYFPIKQHKYLFMDTPTMELEVGHTYQLTYQKSPDYSSTAVTWRSEADKFASVSQDGLVTALAVEKGKAKDVRIYASLGKVEDVNDYNDYTLVTVFDVPDKVDAVRGVGSYEKQDSMVTSNCPIVITNRYYKDITVDSLCIVGTNSLGKDSLVANITDKLPITMYANFWNNNYDTWTFNITPSLKKVKNPRIRVEFTCDDKKYTKYVNY